MRILLVSILIFYSNLAFAQNPLQPFEAIIGGEWWLGEDRYQTFSWGVGELSVKAEAFFVKDGNEVKVSEGEWFFHPGKQKIKGFFLAENMPVTFFDYESEFDAEGTLINQIVGYDPSGKPMNFYETWNFTSADTFIWSLSTKNEDGTLSEVMNGNYTRIFE